jgi:hypothetical protein
LFFLKINIVPKRVDSPASVVKMNAVIFM